MATQDGSYPAFYGRRAAFVIGNLAFSSDWPMYTNCFTFGSDVGYWCKGAGAASFESCSYDGVNVGQTTTVGYLIQDYSTCRISNFYMTTPYYGVWVKNDIYINKSFLNILSDCVIGNAINTGYKIDSGTVSLVSCSSQNCAGTGVTVDGTYGKAYASGFSTNNVTTPGTASLTAMPTSFAFP